jgi:acetylornithine deacetylase/succinyl-diaminopimelate desuccinylase-like protein
MKRVTAVRLGAAVALLAALSAGLRPGAAGEAQSAQRRDPAVTRALSLIRDAEPQTLLDQVRFCETPAPPFGERARGELLRRAFLQLGLRSVRTDREGNVIGEQPGAAARPHVVVAAHLDTVFPRETDVKVKRSGTTLRGPGIGDNCRGLAVLVAIARALRASGARTAGTVTFVANVGEEGLGDLRGVKALFGVGNRSESGKPTLPPIDRFVSIDGAGIYITHVAVGSRRYRITFKGPGGHSFGAFGTPNPANALGRAVSRIAEFKVPDQPRTTFNVGRIGGGTSVNSIPFEAWMEVDLRSSDSKALAALEARLLRAVDMSVDEENARWGSKGAPAVTATKDLVGDRPAGVIAPDAPIVQAALNAGRSLGLTVPLGEGSTDANTPISLGIPAITIGGGGSGADAHALTESFDSTDSWKGTQYAFLVTISLAR